jgi:hypothetical protein
MYTRKQYLNKECTHEQYYGEIAKNCGINYDYAVDLPEIIKALQNGDKHLNTISLQQWDNKALTTQARIAHELKNRGDSFSQAGSVCVHKAAARMAAEKKMTNLNT